MTQDPFDTLCEEMFRKHLEVNPQDGTVFGLHEPYDHRLPNGGLKGVQDSLRLMEDWSRKAHEIADAADLSTEQKIGLRLLDQSIGLQKFAMEDYQFVRMWPDGLELAGNLLFMMFSRDYAPYEERIKAITSRLKEVPRFLEQFRSRFDGVRMVKLWVEMSIETCEQLPGFLEFVVDSSKGKVSEEVMKNLTESAAAAGAAAKAQLDWLKANLENADSAFPMGDERLSKLLELRGIPYTPEELLSLAEGYLSEFKEERRRVAARIAPGKTVEEAAKVVQMKSPRDFEEALDATKKEIKSAKEFISEKGLSTIDRDAKLIVLETPEFLTPVLPYAALYMPSKFDKKQEGQYVVTRPKDPANLAVNLNYAAIINVAVHEAYPGHFHQGVETNKRTWMIQLTAPEAPIAGVETAEGWALYCEKMMFDHGYNATDEGAFEMLNGAIWRACRVIADVKLAQGTATVEEMIEWMTKETGMARDAMVAEVKRYTRMPTYALSYLLGRHLITEFRKEIERKAGKDFDERKFHDLIASYGCLPFNLMREAVLDQLGLNMEG